jgi:hypothetical protein
MIKLKSALLEEEDPRIKKLAHARGYAYETYRGDTDAGRIYAYTRKERREYGIFTTTDKEVAAVYARDKDPRRFYVRAPKILNLMEDSLKNMMWVKKWGESFDEWRDPQTGEEVDAWYILEGGRMFDYEGDWSSHRWRDIQASADSDGYDAVILPDTDHRRVFPSFVVFDERNLKLADSMTYDDEKNPIPYHHRFDSSLDDIRY